jgi:heptosyltransferase III
MAERILAIRPGGIGDSILSFPALQHLAQQAELDVWARSEVLPLVQFARAESIAASGLDTLGIPGREVPLPLRERLEAYSRIHSWYGTQRGEFRAALEALHPRVTFHDALPVSEDMHAADFFAAQVGAALPAIPRIPLVAERNRLILIHPFSGSARKNWPLESYLLLGRWLEASGRAVQFIVAPTQALPGARAIACLGELGSWIAGAPLYIGNDSGITHLAAAMGTPVLALFGPTNPAVWAPRGPQIRVLHEDLDRLSVERVLDAALA